MQKLVFIFKITNLIIYTSEGFAQRDHVLVDNILLAIEFGQVLSVRFEVVTLLRHDLTLGLKRGIKGVANNIQTSCESLLVIADLVNAAIEIINTRVFCREAASLVNDTGSHLIKFSME